MDKLTNQLRFINEIVLADLVVCNHTEASLLAELAARGYTQLANESKQVTGSADQRQEHVTNTGYDYLLELPIRSFTRDRVPSSTYPSLLWDTRAWPKSALS